MSDDVTITVRVNDRTAAGFRDVNGRLRDLQGRFASAAGDMQRSSNRLTASLDTASGSAMRLAPSLTTVGAAIGTSLLPAVGAAAPMLLGFGAAGGAAALAMDGMKKQAKELKKPFEEWKKVAEKAVLPHTAKAIDSLKGAMKDLTPVIKMGGETFGRVAEQAAKFADSPAFKSALIKNVQMGSGFIEDFAGSLTGFTQAFLDFGTKSQPSLDAFQNLFGGLLDTGLPGMFKGLETGIKGASQVIDGLAYALNDKLLPAFGRFSGEWAAAVGPLFEQGFRALGDIGGAALDTLAGGLRLAAPFLKDLAEGLRGMLTVADALAPAMKATGEGIASLFLSEGDLSNVTGPLGALAEVIDRNKLGIQEAGRLFGQTVLGMAEAALTVAPLIVDGFATMSTLVLDSIDVLVSGAAAAFGDLPLIGDTFKDANAAFDVFKGKYVSGLEDAKTATREFSEVGLSKLSKAELKLNISTWEAQIKTAKEQLKSVPPEKRSVLEAYIADLEQKVAAAKVEIGSVHGKSVTITANTGPFRSSIGGLAGRVLGTSYINVMMRRVESNVQPKFNNANGSIMRFYADGGSENHVAQIAPAGSWRVWGEPETGGEAYIPLSPAKRGRSRAIAEETVDVLGGAVKWFAKGGTTKSEAQARKQAWSDLTVSHFGRMAGSGRSEFGSALGRPDSVSALVSALSQWRGIIMKATHGGTENRLLRQLDSTGRKLLGWEKQLGSATKSLEKAKGKLDDLKTSAAQVASTVRSGILTSANITRGANAANGGPVTVAGIMGGLTASRDKATAFSGALAGLKKMGLSSSLLRQIAEAGIEGGGLETAGALLSASSSEIGSLNDLQSQIGRSAKSAGKTTADAVYGKAIREQTKTVKGLEKSQDKLRHSMDKLARSMERALERAFKGKAAGGIVGAAASGGLRSNLTWVGEQGPELLDLPAGSRVWSNPDSRRKASAPWASMLNTPRRPVAAGAHSAAAGPAGDGQPIVIQLKIGDRDFGELWVDAGRKQVRARGSIEATLKPPRGR